MNSVAKYFRFGELGTNFRTELIAGLTTFVSMAYILFVNPTVLGAAGMDKGAVFTATGVAAAIDAFVDADDLIAAVTAFNDTFAGMTVDQALGNTRYGLAIPGKHTNAVQGELH